MATDVDSETADASPEETDEPSEKEDGSERAG
jgi:hypothetical protein